MCRDPEANEPAGRREHEKQDHRALGIPRIAEGRGHHPSVRQSRHHRTADHARAEGPSGPHLCDGDAGEPGRRHGRRFQPRLRQARRLQRPCRAGSRQCDGLAVQRQLHRHADDPDRRPAGAGPWLAGAGAVRTAGADGRAAGEMGGRGDAAGGSAAHRAPRRQDRDDAADRPGVHLAAGRHPQRRGRHRTRPLDPHRHPRPAVGRIAEGVRGAHPQSRAAGDRRRRRGGQERRAEGSRRVRGNAGLPGLSVVDAVRRAFPVREPVLHGRAGAHPETRPRCADALRPHHRRRRRSAADVGLQRSRSAAGRHLDRAGRPRRSRHRQELQRRCRAQGRRQGNPARADPGVEGRRRQRAGEARQAGTGRTGVEELDRQAQDGGRSHLEIRHHHADRSGLAGAAGRRSRCPTTRSWSTKA